MTFFFYILALSYLLIHFVAHYSLLAGHPWYSINKVQKNTWLPYRYTYLKFIYNIIIVVHLIMPTSTVSAVQAQSNVGLTWLTINIDNINSYHVLFNTFGMQMLRCIYMILTILFSSWTTISLLSIEINTINI